MLRILIVVTASVALGIGAVLIYSEMNEGITTTLEEFDQVFIGEVLQYEKEQRKVILRGSSSRLEEDIVIQFTYDRNTTWLSQETLMKEGYLVGSRYGNLLPDTIQIGDILFIGYRGNLSNPVDVIMAIVHKQI